MDLTRPAGPVAGREAGPGRDDDDEAPAEPAEPNTDEASVASTSCRALASPSVEIVTDLPLPLENMDLTRPAGPVAGRAAADAAVTSIDAMDDVALDELSIESVSLCALACSSIEIVMGMPLTLVKRPLTSSTFVAVRGATLWL